MHTSYIYICMISHKAILILLTCNGIKILKNMIQSNYSYVANLLACITVTTDDKVSYTLTH